MRFLVTSPPGGRGAPPPASLRGTMENASTGQMRSGNPPPGCGGLRRGHAGLGLGPGRTERRSLCFGSIRTAQSRYGSRTGSHAQFIYMMWWQSARVTQRRECRRPAADSGRGAWLRPKPQPRKRVAAAMAPLAQQKTQRDGHGDGAIGVRVASGAFGMRLLGERSVRARNDFVIVGESDLHFVGEDDDRRLRNAFRMALRLEHGVAVPDPCLLNERVAVLPGEKRHVQVQRCFHFRSRP